MLRLAETGKIELCLTPSMLAELAETLGYEKFRPRLAQLGPTQADLMSYAMNLASIFETTGGETIVMADPDDDVFLRCAVAAGAVFVVSGDHHLLDLGQYAGIPILTIREFLDRLVSETPASA